MPTTFTDTRRDIRGETSAQDNLTNELMFHSDTSVKIRAEAGLSDVIMELATKKFSSSLTISSHFDAVQYLRIFDTGISETQWDKLASGIDLGEELDQVRT